jgi:hypothetical protein
MTTAFPDSAGKQPVHTADPAISRLRALASDFPALKETALAYETILPLLREADLGAAPAILSTDEAVAKMEKGSFLLKDVELNLDNGAYCDLMARLALALEQLGRDRYTRAEAARNIRVALEAESLDAGSLLADMTDGISDRTSPMSSDHSLEHDLLWTLGWSSIRPALRKWQRQLSPLVDAAGWGKGHCFVCGAAAAFAELRGNNQSRHLRCSQCGADWPVRRLQCVYCGNDDHRSLSFLYAASQNNPARAEVCDSCNRYIKAILSFEPLSPDLLVVEDLATLSLDFIAMEHGYRRGPALPGSLQQ